MSELTWLLSYPIRLLIKVNGTYIGPISNIDSARKSVATFTGKFLYSKRPIFTIATRIPNSFDGRYFGPVAFTSILGKAKAIFTFN